MKKILVLGAGGFLGRFLIKDLNKKKQVIFSPSSKEVDLLNYSDLINLNQKFDEIFYLAAWTQAGDFCLRNSGNQWIINQLMNTNLIKWWKEYQDKAKLIFIGSSCCYGEGSKLREKDFLFDTPHESLMAYAMSKKMLMHGAISLQKQFNMKWFCGIPATMYGPNYHTDDRQSHFIYDLIKKIMRAKYSNKKVILWGDGNQRREIINVKDFSSHLIELNEIIENDLINIGSVSDFSIKEYAEIICETVDYDPSKIMYDKNKYVGVFEKKLNIEKINKNIKNYDKKLTNINIGIKEVVEWYKTTKAYK
jgi:GDP-L-fucose synthase